MEHLGGWEGESEYSEQQWEAPAPSSTTHDDPVDAQALQNQQDTQHPWDARYQGPAGMLAASPWSLTTGEVSYEEGRGLGTGTPMGAVPFAAQASSGPITEQTTQLGAAADDATPTPTSVGKSKAVMRSGVLMAAGTLVSRATGFLRSLVIAAAIGMSTLGDSYQVANTIPTMVYILVGGGALNAVFLPQLVRSMRDDDDGGEAYANRLITLVICGLGLVTAAAVLAAPLLVRLMSTSLTSDAASASATVSLARYCLPTIFFSGAFVVLGQILNAREQFGAMMWTPVLNNIVIIFTFGSYIYVFGTFHHSGVTPGTVTPEGIRLLGVGTLLGLVVQAGAMIPYLRGTGFRLRLRFDWRGHGLGKAARLAKWTFLFVLANQAGLIAVTQLATAAGVAAQKAGVQGAGINAYLNAQLIWGLPQSVITVSIMTAIMPRMSRAAADEDHLAISEDLSYGLRTTAVAIVPAAFIFLALGRDLGVLLFGLGVGASGGALMVGNMLMAFSLGLIPFSAQYVMLRVFYVFEDTRTPFFNTVWVAGSSAVLSWVSYLLLPARWAVVGMAACYGVAYAVGVLVAARKLKRRLNHLNGAQIIRTYTRLIACGAVGALAAYYASRGSQAILGSGIGGVAAGVIVGCVVLFSVFFVLAVRLRVAEAAHLLTSARMRIMR